MSSELPYGEERHETAEILAGKATLAARAGHASKALALLEASMFIEPTSERIRSWALACARKSDGADREAMQEVASWF